MLSDTARGARCLLRGASLLTHPRLRPFVLVPLAINVLIFAGLLFLGARSLQSALGALLGAMPPWLDFITWLVWPLALLFAGLLVGYLFTAVALLIASPFNALLAEKAEELLTGQPVAGLEGFGAALLALPRGLLRELAKLAHYLPLALAVAVLSLLATVLAPVLWFMLGAWMMSLQFLDYPMDNHGRRFAEVRDLARRHRGASLGFGGAVAACTSIPLLNFFVVPAAVVGATVFWVETREQ